MFLNIAKTSHGYQFRNGNRRMAMDEVARRCPPDWVRDVDAGAANFIDEYIKNHPNYKEG